MKVAKPSQHQISVNSDTKKDRDWKILAISQVLSSFSEDRLSAMDSEGDKTWQRANLRVPGTAGGMEEDGWIHLALVFTFIRSALRPGHK